ncbi:MAG: hypothetical protein U0229_06235 [Anaeromyxobacter sp.]
MNARLLPANRALQLRWGTRALLAAGALGLVSTLASLWALEWIACGLLVAGAMVVHLATLCTACGRARILEVLAGKDGPCPCGGRGRG